MLKTINVNGPYDNWPTGRGFDHYYGFLIGQTNQWYPTLIDDTRQIDPPATPDEGYHVSQDLVDQTIRYVKDLQAADPAKPYFVYLAFGAGHAPHHAPVEYIEKYKGKFDQGWDAVRNETLARQKAMGIVSANTELPPRNADIKAWDDLPAEEKRLFARMMEVYAGFLDHTDHQIGRLIDYLDETDQINNTMIILVSDNGADPGFGAVTNGSFNEWIAFNNIPEDNISILLSKIDELGGPMSYPSYPRGWAMAGNTPFKLYKSWIHEGGIRDPLIIHYPSGIEDKGGIRSQFTHAIDIVPTILEVVGIKAPETYNGIPQRPIEGLSMAYTFDQPDASDEKDIQYFALMGSRGLWYRGWKAVTAHPRNSDNFDKDVWELYNLSQDVSEVHNLAQENPEKLKEMEDRWWAEAGKYNVLPLGLETSFDVPVGPRGNFTYYPGTAAIVEPKIPDTKQSSYTINADVDIPNEGAEGVLLSIGGRFGGLSLYVQNRLLVFDYNYVGLNHTTITSQEEVPTGASILGFSFDKTAEADLKNHTSATGIGTLYINGAEVGRGIISPTIPVRYPTEEGLEIGTDRLTPVTESYKSPYKFSGTLKKVVLESKA